MTDPRNGEGFLLSFERLGLLIALLVHGPSIERA